MNPQPLAKPQLNPCTPPLNKSQPATEAPPPCSAAPPSPPGPAPSDPRSYTVATLGNMVATKHGAGAIVVTYRSSVGPEPDLEAILSILDSLPKGGRCTIACSSPSLAALGNPGRAARSPVAAVRAVAALTKARSLRVQYQYLSTVPPGLAEALNVGSHFER